MLFHIIVQQYNSKTLVVYPTTVSSYTSSAVVAALSLPEPVLDTDVDGLLSLYTGSVPTILVTVVLTQTRDMHPMMYGTVIPRFRATCYYLTGGRLPSTLHIRVTGVAWCRGARRSVPWL